MALVQTRTSSKVNKDNYSHNLIRIHEHTTDQSKDKINVRIPDKLIISTVSFTYTATEDITNARKGSIT